jgi:hypothetical protein
VAGAGGDAALLGGRDAFLEHTHLGGERRLIAHGARHAAEERAHLAARLGEAEDVVDEEQHVLALFIAEVLGHGQRRKRHTRARSRRLVHLAEYQRGLADHGRAALELRLAHLDEQVVALARSLAHARKAAHTAVRLGDVVDELQDQHRLAHAGAAEQADLAALAVGREQVDDLDAGLEQLDLGALVDERRRRTMDRGVALGLHRPGFVHRLADDVQDPAQRFRTHRHLNRATGVGYGRTSHQTLGGIHGNGTHDRFAQMLCDLEHEVLRLAGDVGVGNGQRVQDARQLARRKLHVHDRADHLGDLALVTSAGGGSGAQRRG